MSSSILDIGQIYLWIAKSVKFVCLNIYKSLQDFIRGLLQRSPEKRLTSLQTLNHDWYLVERIINQKDLDVFRFDSRPSLLGFDLRS